MASVFTAGGSATKREPSKVVRYEFRTEDHQFTKLDAAGNKVPTGEEKPVAKLRGVHADGSVDKLAAWVWLDGPESIDAYIDSARDLLQQALQIRAQGEAGLGWAPRPKAQAAQAAPKAEAAPAKPKGSVFTREQAVAKEAAAVQAAPADPFADLPF